MFKRPQAISPGLFALIILYLVPLTGMAVDIYVPSLPAMREAFAVPPVWIKYTITSYMLGYGLSGLVVGSLADSYGRRSILIVGLAVFALCSFAIPYSPDIMTLLLLRSVQGIAVAVPGVITKAVVPDRFQGKALTKFANLMTIVWAMGPILAPAIGGYLQEYLGWQWCFHALGLYSLIGLLAVIVFLPETHEHHVPFRLANSVRTYGHMLSRPAMMGTGVSLGLLYGLIIVFNVLGPFLVQDHLHYSPVEFGHLVPILGVAWLVGNTSNSILVSRFSSTTVCLYALVLLFASCCLMAGFAFSDTFNIYVIILPLVGALLSGSALFTNNFSLALGLFPKAGGSLGALMSTFVTVGAALVSAGVGFIHGEDQRSMSLVYLLLCLITILLYFKLVQPALREREAQLS